MLTAGPRQTVDRVRHPQRGEGIAVYDNGPSFFQPDDGEPVPMGIGFGGASSKPKRAWLVLQDPQHGRVEADHCGPRGETHMRRWHAIHGPGWLVMEPGEGWWHRYEPDEGKPLRFRVGSMCVGTPEYKRLVEKSGRHRDATPEENLWVTLETHEGEILAFRREPPPETAAPPPDPRQQSLFSDA